MKVVINKCYGGFGLSAQVELALVGACSHGELLTPEEYYGPKNTQERLKVDLEFGNVVISDGKIVIDNHRSASARSCPALVTLVERIGPLANGNYAKLKIVEIPDGVDFEIDEYDGIEHIAETHRTWG